MAAERCKHRARLPPHLWVVPQRSSPAAGLRERKDWVRGGTAGEVGAPREAASAAPSLPPIYSRSQGTESGPEECPEGGKELGGPFWGGLEMPLAKGLSQPTQAAGSQLALNSSLPSSHKIQLPDLLDLPPPCQVGETALPLLPLSPSAPSPK